MSRRQCKACPFRKDANPRDIPNGYCANKHAKLRNTIAVPGEINIGGVLRIMACHDSTPGKEQPCVGWLHNQHGPGNNIGLRLAVIAGDISMDIKLVGEQHATFEDTLPK